MRLTKGLEWMLVVAVLAVPAFLFARWKSEISSNAVPTPKPTRIIAVSAPKIEAPVKAAPGEPVVPEKPDSPLKPPEPGEPMLVAMRDPMLSPSDQIALIRRKFPPEAPDAPPPPPPPPRPRIDAGIRLEGVILTDDQPRRAFVNGSILEEGDTVKGAKVLRINADGVVFGKGRKRFTKRLSD